MDKERVAKIAKSKAYVMGHIDPRTGLEQLSEELNEMSQAALKLIRAAGWNGNPTPLNYKEALSDLNEEFCDVLMCLEVLTENGPDDLYQCVDHATISPKWIRWATRIKECECDAESCDS